MMDFSLTDTQLELRKEIIAFAKEHLNDNVEQRDREANFDHELWEKCGEIRLPGLCIPTEYGGRGLDAVSTVLALEALGYACEDGGLNFAISAHLLACLVPIWLHGTEAQKKNLLPNLCNGKKVAANAMTESTSGSDAFNMNTKADKKKEGFILNGTKSFVSNGPVADVVVTYAESTPGKGFFGGISAFVLEKGKHSFKPLKKLNKVGIRTCPLSEMQFENLEVQERYLLGKQGGGGVIFTQSMDWERICLGAIHLGTMDRILEKVAKFVKKNKLQDELNVFKFAKFKAKVEAAKLLTYKAAWKLEQGKNVGMDASICKLFTSEIFKELSEQCCNISIHPSFIGGKDIQRAFRDAVASTIYSGTSEIQGNIIAAKMRAI